jgi:membrane associated rhomboid family serine protease
VSVIIVTYFQRTTPPALLGRMMSLFMIAMFAVMPLSQALSGALVRVGVEALFLGAAGGMLAACALAATRPEIRRLGEPRRAPATMHCLEPQRVPEG